MGKENMLEQVTYYCHQTSTNMLNSREVGKSSGVTAEIANNQSSGPKLAPLAGLGDMRT